MPVAQFFGLESCSHRGQTPHDVFSWGVRYSSNAVSISHTGAILLITTEGWPCTYMSSLGDSGVMMDSSENLTIISAILGQT